MKSPFKFLDAYTLRDKDVFFGRDAEIVELYNLVFKTPLLLVYGLSGTGKTSLIQCGLAGRFDGPDWYPMFIRRDQNINESLNKALRQAVGQEHTGDLVQDVSYLLRKSLRPVYLIFDQFEELFILGEQKEQQTFMEGIAALLEADLPAKVILVMREEYIGHLYPFENVVPQLFDHRFRVERMGITRVKSVITKSFEKFNVHIEEPVEEQVDLMVSNISDEKTGIALPYLQVYLDMLYRTAWRKAPDAKKKEDLPELDLTRAMIERIGEIDDVLERFLIEQQKSLQEQLSEKFPGVSDTAVYDVLDAFVTDQGTKRPVRYTRDGEVISLDTDDMAGFPALTPEALTACIDMLEQARLLRISEDTIEIAHDTLGAVIDQNRSDEQRQLNAINRRLMNAYDEYQSTGVFLNAKQLAALEEFVPRLNLSTELTQFIEDSKRDVERREREKRELEEREIKIEQQKKAARIQRILLGVIAVFFLIAAGMAVVAWVKANDASEQAALVEERNNLLLLQQDTIQRLLAQTQRRRDSLRNIITDLKGQMVQIDSIIGSSPSRAVFERELRKTLVAFRTILQTEIDPQIRNLYGVTREFATASDVNRSPGIWQFTRSGSFNIGARVHIYMRVATTRRTEVLQLKWLKGDGTLIVTQFFEIERNPDRGYQTTTYKQFRDPGKYEVKLYNYLGLEIANAEFDVN